MIALSGPDRALTRMGAMLRLYSVQEGTILREAMTLLNSDDLEKVIQQFDLQAGEELQRTPTYMPVVLLNLSKSLDLTAAVTIGLPFIAKVLEQHKLDIVEGYANPEIPLNFNKMGAVAKSQPGDLLLEPFYVDEEGNVLLGCPCEREQEAEIEGEEPLPQFEEEASVGLLF